MPDTNFTGIILSLIDSGEVEETFSGASARSNIPENPPEVAIPSAAIPFLMEKLKSRGHVIYAAVNESEAETLFETAKAIDPDALFFPDIDVIPYTNVFPSGDKLADRVRTLHALANRDKPALVVTTLESLLRKLPSPERFRTNTLTIKPGDRIDPDTFAKKLTLMGYNREFKVLEQCSFSIRGDIADVYPPYREDALRVNFFGDTVESVKTFQPATQVSTGMLESAVITPAVEFALPEGLDDESAAKLHSPSIHSFFPDLFGESSMLTAYGKLPVVLILPENYETVVYEIASRYNNYLPEGYYEDHLLYGLGEIEANAALKAVYAFDTDSTAARTNVFPAPEFNEGFSSFVSRAGELIADGKTRLFLLVEHEELARRLVKILEPFDPAYTDLSGGMPDSPMTIVRCGIERGFELKTDAGERLLILSESDVSGKKRLFRKRIRQIETMFSDLEEIQEGETVVHLNYGIGIFKGVRRIEVLGTAKDYIVIHYVDEEKLFVPLEQSNLIGKYIGVEGKKPILDSLGGKSWQRKRAKVQASIQEFAQKLVAIYAKRAALQGHAFAADNVWQKQFEDRFEYIETPDQVKVLEEIKRDMEDRKPMDRLLCGDVGFGKTEVAMRAAFKVVMDGKQVAVIAPTTVLVEQHYYTFTERFKGFPVRIEYVSRFTPAHDLSRIVKALAEHKIDILIGTHKLFSEKLVFRSLGAVIIDEEHKFGVEHKEALKARYPTADFLALSATPIPRTLHMAMSTIRDISLLQTPPDMRIPVQTYVSDFTQEVVKFAIQKELDRGGQVFFVHNTIKRLKEYAYFIAELDPRAKVCIGHGQMHEEQLDEAFMGFVKGHYNVFVCTTIIDSGLDIPNANTIIISDAHKFGLSQLYQLKGRVGRSKREGYSYFLYPKERALTETAQKRLYVISEYTDLGAGFHIALKDLEIRGAGNILGREQHGNMIAVGYDVYMRLLKDEVKKLRGEFHEEIDTLIDLKYNAYIPDAFIPDSATKMEVYKKIVSAKSEDEIRLILHELSDRFGKIPGEVMTLFEISRLKIAAGEMGIESLIEKDKFIEITFSKFSRIDPVKAIQSSKSGKHPIEIRPDRKHTVFYRTFDSSVDIKVKALTAFLNDVRE